MRALISRSGLLVVARRMAAVLISAVWVFVAMKWFVGAPELHHWHHDRARDAGNYANISPLMDLAFGTYRCPDHEPEAFGIQEEIPRSYLGQMLHPFRRRGRR